MWGKLALLAAGGVIGYLGKKIYDENQTSAPKSQDVVRDCHAEDKRDNQEAVVIPESAVIPEPVIITESAAAAALKHIYENNGPGDLNWDVSVAGQVTVKDGRVEAHEGALISLNLKDSALHGVLKLHDVETLSILKADHCNLKGIDFKNLSSLKELSLKHNYIVDIGPLASLKSLAILNLYRQSGQSCENGKLENLKPLAGLINLTKLDAGSNKISDLSPLAGLTALTELDVLSNYLISDLSPLAGLFALTKLEVSFNDVSDLNPLAGLTNLTELSVSGQMSTGISDLNPLANLTSLTKLSLSGNRISTLSPLAALTGLKKFQVYDAVCSDLSPLDGMTNLEDLHISCSTVSDINPLARLTSLRKLDVARCTISDLSPLAGLTNLRELDVSGNEVIDLRPLSGLTSLTKLDIGYNMICDFTPLGSLKKLVSDDSFTNQRKETRAALAASAKKEAYARKIGKCPHCKRIIRYPDIEAWEPYRWSNLLVWCSAPMYRKSGKCPDCGQPITVQGIGSSLFGMPFYLYPWEIVTEGRPTTFDRIASLVFPGLSG